MAAASECVLEAIREGAELKLYRAEQRGDQDGVLLVQRSAV